MHGSASPCRAGLEKLAGILLAHLNHLLRKDTQPLAACFVQNGVFKVHGGNFRPAELSRRQAERGSSAAQPGGLTQQPLGPRGWSCQRGDASGTRTEAVYLQHSDPGEAVAPQSDA